MLCRDGSLFEDAKLGIPPGVAKLVVTLKAFPVFKPFELSKGERCADFSGYVRGKAAFLSRSLPAAVGPPQVRAPAEAEGHGERAAQSRSVRLGARQVRAPARSEAELTHAM